MRITSIKQGEHIHLVVVEGDAVWLVQDLNAALPEDQRLPESAIDFIEQYHENKPQVENAVRTAIAQGGIASTPLTDVVLAPPIPNARKLLCVAANYAEHITETGGRAPDARDTLQPRVFMKPPSTTMIGSGAPVILPPYARAIDWELELGVVIGRRAMDISPQEACDVIFGYTIVNDISERKFDPGPRSKARPGDEWFDWLNGKWHDTFAPVGPVVVSADELPDPHALRMKLEVNGNVKQDSTTANMIHDVFTLVAFFSRIFTLEVGDIIATGTPAGVGAATGEFLKAGDVMRATIDGIGTLINPVEATK